MTCKCGKPAVKRDKCVTCHLDAIRPPAKTNWTPEQEALLRAAYQQPRLKDLSAALRRLEEVTGYSRDAIRCRALKLGLNFVGWSKWTAEQDRTLRELAGSRSTSAIARKFGKTVHAVQVRMSRLGISGRVSDGYTALELSTALGVAFRRVQKWEQEGWLRRNQNGRFSETSVAMFVRRMRGEYDLRRVDQTWFKDIAFGDYSTYA